MNTFSILNAKPFVMVGPIGVEMKDLFRFQTTRFLNWNICFFTLSPDHHLGVLLKRCENK